MSLITSRQNPRIKSLVKLWQRQERDATGCFLIEGFRETERAAQAGVSLREFFYCPKFWRDKEASEKLMETLRGSGAELVELSPEVFEKVSLREGPDGILALAWSDKARLEELPICNDSLVLVLERVEKPGNLGALLRSAEAAGAAAVLCADALVDFHNPHVIRNSQGAVFSLPCMADTGKRLRAFLKERGLRLAATTPDTDTLYWDADFRGGLALCFGNEHSGLTPEWLEAADVKVRIPMMGSADSLNVSVSAALCLYEALRQRQ